MSGRNEIASAPETVRELYKMALMTRERAYCPYSGHKVGAAILTKSGRIFTGCNIENSSFGATVCAERVAIQKAISEQGELALTDVMVVTDADPAWPPCGLCRQVIAEFGQEVRIHSANLAGIYESFSLDELFPKAFTPAYLSR